MDDSAEAHAYAAADFSSVNAAFAERLAELAHNIDKAEALDLGTGPADIPIRVAKLKPAWRITGADASSAMLDIARKNVAAAGLRGRVVLVKTDAKGMQLPEAAFDVVFSNSILHHITDTHAFWSEVTRVAKPGALVFFRDLARPASAAGARAIVDTYAGTESALLKEEYYRSLLSAYTVEEVRAQLAKAGVRGLAVAMATDRHLDIHGRLQS
jgi:ubiquinone/menaquinone biosynthesis C-methylase UbiE